jgi:hypothetical protein
VVLVLVAPGWERLIGKSNLNLVAFWKELEKTFLIFLGERKVLPV